MYVVEYDEIEVDLCPDCRGTWLDHGELELLLERVARLDLQLAETREARRPCPICRHKMDKVNIGPADGVLIDACGDGCGLWFDNEELRELTRDLGEKGWRVPDGVRDFLGNMFPAPHSDSGS